MELEIDQIHTTTLNIPKTKGLKKKNLETLNVLSLFSGCGGMDLGFEGGFDVLKSSVNEVTRPNFIVKKFNNGFVKLQKTKFKTVFANDILSDAKNVWAYINSLSPQS